MSTRTNIGFYENKEDELKDWKVMLYKHSDGYPKSVIPLIQEYFSKDAVQGRLNDVEYNSAWFLYYMISEHVEMMKELAKKYSHIEKDGFDLLGHGICDQNGLHGDIEYYYKLTPKNFSVYETGFDGGFEEFKLLGTFSYSEEIPESIMKL